jgi:hypothetical protein
VFLVCSRGCTVESMMTLFVLPLILAFAGAHTVVSLEPRTTPEILALLHHPPFRSARL